MIICCHIDMDSNPEADPDTREEAHIDDCD